MYVWELRKRAMRLTTAILETGASPNLIREDVLPPNSQAYVNPFKTSLKSAGNTTFSVKGVVQLQVDIGGNIVSKLFGMALVLAIEAILGTALTDKYIMRIKPFCGLIVTKKGNLRQYAPLCRETSLII